MYVGHTSNIILYYAMFIYEVLYTCMYMGGHNYYRTNNNVVMIVFVHV